MPSEFFAIITRMRAGEISAVARTLLGFHIVQVTDKKPAAEMTFEQSQPEIRLTRENLKRRAAVEALQAELSRKSDSWPCQRFEKREIFVISGLRPKAFDFRLVGPVALTGCLENVPKNKTKRGGNRPWDYWEPRPRGSAPKRFSCIRLEPNSASGPEFRRRTGRTG